MKTLSPWKKTLCINAENKDGVKKTTSSCGNILKDGINESNASETSDSSRRFARRIMLKDGNEKRSLRWRETSVEDNPYMFNNSIRMLPTIRAAERIIITTGLIWKPLPFSPSVLKRPAVPAGRREPRLSLFERFIDIADLLTASVYSK